MKAAPKGPWAAIGRRLSGIATDRVRLLSLIEQGTLSAANFLGLLLLARGVAAEAFGLYSFAWLSLLFVVNLHRSAVVVPFVVHAADTDILAAEAACWRRLNLWTGLSFTALLATIAAALPPFGAPGWMSTAFVVAALLVVPTFGYEFRRRWLIQLERHGVTVGAALLYAAIHLGGVAAAVVLHRIEAAVAGTIAANLAAWGLCLARTPRLDSAASATPMRPFLARLTHFIGWSVASNLAYNGYCHLPALLLGGLTGPIPVAAFQALRNFIQPLATLATAIDNFDKPRAVRAMAAHGEPGLRRSLLNTTAALAGFALPYSLLLLMFGGQLIGLVYGERYQDWSSVLPWLVATHWAGVLAYPAETALFLLRRPDLLFRGRVLSAVAGVALTVVLAPRWGPAGALAGMIGGQLVSAALAAFHLYRIPPWTDRA